MRRWAYTALAIGLVSALVASIAASAAVKRVSVTSPVRQGDNVTLTVNVSPRARCRLAVTAKYSTGLRRVERHPAKAGGRITWRWRTFSEPGRWPIVVSCGKSGVLRTTFVVRAEMPLKAAAKAICDRAPSRVRANYPVMSAVGAELIPDAGPIQGTTDAGVDYYTCAFDIRADEGNGGWYALQSRRGPTHCTITVKAAAGPEWPNGNMDWSVLAEMYTETCKSLRG